MRLLVTGATGFIGKNLTRQLVDQGNHVEVIIRHSSDARSLVTFDCPERMREHDGTTAGMAQIIAAGGKGGRGNAHFATSTNRFPKLAEAGEELDLEHLMPPLSRLTRIMAAFQNSDSRNLAPVREILGADFSYDEIRLVRIYLQRQGQV